MINRVQLLGNVGKDPEVKHLDSGSVVANFSLATSETYKNKAGEKVSTTEWHNVIIWGKLAEVVEMWVKKGSQLFLEGKITTRSWEDKEGNKRYMTEIVCNNMQMLGGNKSNSGPTEDKPSESNNDNYEGEDLPF